MPLLQQHFSDGQLKLRCSAQIVGVYQRDTDLVFANAVAENIYEKGKRFGDNIFLKMRMNWFCF